MTPTPAPPPSGSAPGDTWTRPVDGMLMVYLPAGQFELGSDEAEIDAALEQCEPGRDSGGCGRDWFENEAPRHAVDLEAFWIDRTEVTNAEFAAFLNAQGNQIEGGVAWLEVDDVKSPIELADGGFRTPAGSPGFRPGLGGKGVSGFGDT